MNRAFDGDVVVIELLPEAQWEAPGSRIPRGGAGGASGGHKGDAGEGGGEGRDDEDVDVAAHLAPVRTSLSLSSDASLLSPKLAMCCLSVACSRRAVCALAALAVQRTA